MAKENSPAQAGMTETVAIGARSPANLTECLDGEMLARILHFTREKDGRMPTSAYERFRALAELSDELYLHPILDELAYLLAEGFGITEELTPTSCDRLWRRSSDLLLEQADIAEACRTLLLHRPWPRKAEIDPFSGDLSRQLLSSLPELSSLVETQARSRLAWEKEIADTLDAMKKQGKSHFLFTVPEDYTFVRPDPYHVDQAIAAEVRKEETRDLLLSQCLRQLFLLSAMHGITPVLHLRGRAEPILALLTFLGRSIALPRLCIAAEQREELACAIEEVGRERIPNVGFAIRLADHPADADLHEAICSAARRYPFGRLCFICAEEVSVAERRLRGALHVETK